MTAKPVFPIWRLRTLSLSLERPLLMGILNVTPDSFSDGGRYASAESALKRALQLAEEGADLLDVGAESTRPGAAPVDSQEEWARLEPVLRVLKSQLSLPLSVDTRRGSVARRGLDMGVEAINDVSMAADPELLAAVAESGSGYVLMHSRGEPVTMMERAVYRNLVEEVSDELQAGLNRLAEAGIASEKIAIDPGFGFAKTPEQNWELLGRLSELKKFGLPLLAGLSRKRMLQELVGTRSEALAAASAAAASAAVFGGARVLRVHDVGATRAVFQVLQKLSRVEKPF